jgi:hypothetical protein
VEWSPDADADVGAVNVGARVGADDENGSAVCARVDTRSWPMGGTPYPGGKCGIARSRAALMAWTASAPFSAAPLIAPKTRLRRGRTPVDVDGLR